MTTNIKPSQFKQVILEDIVSLARAVAVGASNRIIDKQPVASGGLRGSTIASINSEAVEFGNLDPSGSSTKSRNQSTISKANAGDEINIICGAPYGAIIEHGNDTHSPIGFFITTGEELPAIINEAKQTKENYK